MFFYPMLWLIALSSLLAVLKNYWGSGEMNFDQQGFCQDVAFVLNVLQLHSFNLSDSVINSQKISPKFFIRSRALISSAKWLRICTSISQSVNSCLIPLHSQLVEPDWTDQLPLVLYLKLKYSYKKIAQGRLAGLANQFCHGLASSLCFFVCKKPVYNKFSS